MQHCTDLQGRGNEALCIWNFLEYHTWDTLSSRPLTEQKNGQSNANKSGSRKSCREEQERQKRKNAAHSLHTASPLCYCAPSSCVTQEGPSQVIRQQWHLMHELVIPFGTEILKASLPVHGYSALTDSMQVLRSSWVTGEGKNILIIPIHSVLLSQ